MNRRVRSDEEIRKNPLLLAAAFEVTGQHLSRQHRAFLIGWQEVDLPFYEELVDTIPVPERRENLRKCGLAYDQLSLDRCPAKGSFGLLAYTESAVSTSSTTELSIAVIIPAPPQGTRRRSSRRADDPFPPSGEGVLLLLLDSYKPALLGGEIEHRSGLIPSLLLTAFGIVTCPFSETIAFIPSS